MTEVLSSSPIKIDRLDPSADRIIPADAKLESIANGSAWVEGPVWVKDSLFFADNPAIASVAAADPCLIYRRDPRKPSCTSALDLLAS